MKPNEDDWKRAALICREVAELPDRTNPDENADFMLVTGDELQPMIADAFAELRSENGWRELAFNNTEGKPPFDGKPVLIATNHPWTNRVHRVVWTDAVHGKGVFGWAIEDLKHGPYPLRGYTMVTHWMPLPDPPALPETTIP